MKCLITVVILLVLTAGCATHYHKVQGNMLELYLKKPEAMQLILFYSRDGFEPHEARQENGRWVVSLPAGESFRYYYVVDDKIFIPSCRMKENDDFGSENCIFDPDM